MRLMPGFFSLILSLFTLLTAFQAGRQFARCTHHSRATRLEGFSLILLFTGPFIIMLIMILLFLTTIRLFSLLSHGFGMLILLSIAFIIGLMHGRRNPGKPGLVMRTLHTIHYAHRLERKVWRRFTQRGRG